LIPQIEQSGSQIREKEQNPDPQLNRTSDKPDAKNDTEHLINIKQSEMCLNNLYLNF